MIKPDMIPDEAMNALLRALQLRKGGREALAAALNAWQTPKHKAIVGSAIDEVGGFFPAIILPLPQENTNAEA